MPSAACPREYAATRNFASRVSIQLLWSNPLIRRLPNRPARLVLPQFAIPQSRQIWVCSLSTQLRSHAFTDVASVNCHGLSRSSGRSRQATRLHPWQPPSMDKHVNKVSCTCFYLLHALRHFRPAIRRRRQHDRLLCRRLAAWLCYCSAVRCMFEEHKPFSEHRGLLRC